MHKYAAVEKRMINVYDKCIIYRSISPTKEQLRWKKP